MLVKRLYKEYISEKNNYDKIENYYLGKTDALENYTNTQRSNLKINLNYLKKFVKEETAYSVGNPITYQSKNKDGKAVEALDNILENYRENHDIDAFNVMVTYGLVYEVHFIDKRGELQARYIKPTEGYHEEDNQGELTAFIHVYKVKEYYEETESYEVVTYIDNYLSDKIETYKYYNGEYKLIDETEHYFGEIPVGLAKISEDRWKDTIYSDIKGIQDALETNLSDISNEISDFRNSYMILRGLTIEEEDVENFKKNTIIEIPNSDGNAEWLIKNINDSFIRNTIGSLHEKLYEITSHLNHNDAQQMSNASGIALKSRLIALTQRCSINEGAFRELLKTRIRIAFTYLSISKNEHYDWKNINIRFTPTIPNDDTVTADIISKLDGKLSAETGLSLLSFVENGKAEYERAQNEITNSLEEFNLHEEEEVIDEDGVLEDETN